MVQKLDMRDANAVKLGRRTSTISRVSPNESSGTPPGQRSGEPKPEVVECAIVELLDIARRQGITPADFYSIAGPRNASSGFLGSGEAGT